MRQMSHVPATSAIGSIARRTYPSSQPPSHCARADRSRDSVLHKTNAPTSRAELDAAYFDLYQLTRPDVEYILSTL